MGYQRVARSIMTETTAKSQPEATIAPSRPSVTPTLFKLQRQIGNRAVSQMLQAKMTVGKPNDVHEQEADRVADTVMRMPEPMLQRQEEKEETAQMKPISPLLQRQGDEQKDETAQPKSLIGPITSIVQRQEEKEETAQMLQRQEEKKDEHAQAKGSSDPTPAVSPQLESRIQTIRGGGQPLPDNTRTFFESSFGHDFGGIRVHTDSQAAETAGQLNAQAFTIGRNVFFGAGHYEPHTSKGQWLMAHELTHTIQQQPSQTIATNRNIVQSRSNQQISRSTDPIAIQRKVSGGKAPASPTQDPAFMSAIAKVKTTAKQQQHHPTAKSKADEAQAAVKPPTNDVSSKAAGNQVQQMDRQQPKAFNRKAFKAALIAKIAASAPKTLEEADKFKESGKVGALKGELTGEVDTSKQQSQGAIADKVAGIPDAKGIKSKTVQSLPPNPTGTAPAGIDGALSAPKPKTDAETSLQAGSQSLDKQMATADVTESQLKKSNEPDFQTAADAKQQAQADAIAAPQAYRQDEQGTITQAQSQAASTAKTHLTGMHGIRGQSQSKTTTAQQQAQQQDEQKRAEVANELQDIYTQTKQAAADRLARLDTDVDREFDRGANAAQQFFEDYVKQRMDTYKDDRYDRIGGSVLWLKDKLLGLPSEVNQFYERGRELYIAKMDAVLDRVAVVVEKGLNEAKLEIAKGRKAIQTKLEQQPANLRKALQQDATELQSQFDRLEQSVDDKQNQLIDSLTQKYNEKLQAIDARIGEMKAANQGLVDAAFEAIGGVIKAIIGLKNMLLGVLSRAAAAIKKIIKDPIGFLGNLVAGVKQGFMKFIGNIATHLQAGIMGWLFGAMAEGGIQLPKDFDIKGILNLILQVLGATWTFIRARAVNILGEKVVKAMETTAEIFQILMTQGISGVWEYIKEQVSHLKDVVIDGIKSFVSESIIKAGVTWIIGLLNPAGAFIKACKAIYDIIMFFVERGSQIIALVNAVIDSVSAIADGAIGVAATAVENALAKAIPVVIGFMASLLGVTGISTKIREVIAKVQEPVGKAIDWLINKAYNLVKGAGKLLGFGKGKDNKLDQTTQSDSSTTVKEPFNMGTEGHTLTAKVNGKSLEITMASDVDLNVEIQISSALIEIEKDQSREDSQKKAILVDLEAARKRVQNIRVEYESAGKPEAFDKFAKPRLAKIIGDLSRLAKYNPPITSLQHIISQGKPRYIPSGFKIRKKLYDAATKGKWADLSKSLKAPHISAISAKLFQIWKLRDNNSNPANYANANKEWDKAQADKEIPVNKAPTFASYDHPKHFSTFEYETDHEISLGNFWNNGEKNSNDDARSKTTLDKNNLKVLTQEANNDKSGVAFERNVGLDFSSDVANCPKGSATIDGIPFKDTP
jgi:hypothetical protein